MKDSLRIWVVAAVVATDLGFGCGGSSGKEAGQRDRGGDGDAEPGGAAGDGDATLGGSGSSDMGGFLGDGDGDEGSGGRADGGAGAGENAAGGAGTGGSPPVVAPVGSPVATHGHLSVQGTNLVDQSGNPLQLRGMSGFWTNYVSWQPEQNSSALTWMRDTWGVSVVRVAMGVEDPGGYVEAPSTNMNEVRAAIEAAIAAGLYIIVDFHSHNAHLHETDAITFFSEIAQDYGDRANILYETYNEPLDTVTWGADVKPYHETVVPVIRARDPDNVIVLGSPTWSQDVDIAAADPLSGANLMYTLHFYACTHQDDLLAKAQAALDAGLPLFVTEWGATEADGGQGDQASVCEAPAQKWHDWMDANDISWAGWSLCRETSASCPVEATAPVTGGWNKSLKGHGPFIRDRLERYDATCENNPRLIDSIEDGTTSACQLGTYAGRWFMANDGTGTQSPATMTALATAPTVSRYGSSLAVRSWGSGFDTTSGWGAILGVVLNDNAGAPEYLSGSSFAGLRFHARGSGTVDVRIATGRTSEPANGGYCTGDACNSHFRLPLTLSTGDWVPHVIPFAWLESEELGDMTATDIAQMISVEFSASSASFDIWVDDLGFY